MTTHTGDLIFEIGVEEIPAHAIEPAASYIQEQCVELFKTSKLSFGEVKKYYTPRRLVLLVKDLSVSQNDEVVEVFGPPASVAFDTQKQYTRAALGFAQKNNVSPDQLYISKTEKGDYVTAKVQKKGELTKNILSQFFPSLLAKIPFPKRMTWGSDSVDFIRPLAWILCVFYKDVIPFAYGLTTSDRYTFGHSILFPKKIEIQTIEDYHILLREHKVIVDANERKNIIRTQGDTLAKTVNGKFIPQENLLDEVSNLTEFPRALLGSFEKSYLNIPKEILVSEMQQHQRYFPVFDDNDNILPHFIVVSNNDTVAYERQIIAGNERVLRARFADGSFYYHTDIAQPLVSNVKKLQNSTFHQDLGSLFQKVERLVLMGKGFASLIAKGESSAFLRNYERAAYLCKADLISGVVHEFPHLQGIMGYYYAVKSGEVEQAAIAIKEHYLPKSSSDTLPQSQAGLYLALADRIDTLCGMIGIGLEPSGSQDPYALRRAALGIIRILLENSMPVHVSDLVNIGVKGFENTGFQLPKKDSILPFIRQRLKHYLQNSAPVDQVEAVLHSSGTFVEESLYHTHQKLSALIQFSSLADYKTLVILVKRVMNILKDVTHISDNFHENLLIEEAERSLYQVFKQKQNDIERSIADYQYHHAYKLIVSLKAPIDHFFDEVMVNCEDEVLKNNRLHLLQIMKDTLIRLADFRQLQVEA